MFLSFQRTRGWPPNYCLCRGRIEGTRRSPGHAALCQTAHAHSWRAAVTHVSPCGAGCRPTTIAHPCRRPGADDCAATAHALGLARGATAAHAAPELGGRPPVMRGDAAAESSAATRPRAASKQPCRLPPHTPSDKTLPPRAKRPPFTPTSRLVQGEGPGPRGLRAMLATRIPTPPRVVPALRSASVV